jgi:hypothetical protein
MLHFTIAAESYHMGNPNDICMGCVAACEKDRRLGEAATTSNGVIGGGYLLTRSTEILPQKTQPCHVLMLCLGRILRIKLSQIWEMVELMGGFFRSWKPQLQLSNHKQYQTHPYKIYPRKMADKLYWDPQLIFQTWGGPNLPCMRLSHQPEAKLTFFIRGSLIVNS